MELALLNSSLLKSLAGRDLNLVYLFFQTDRQKYISPSYVHSKPPLI
jgi:hypothetical protein